MREIRLHFRDKLVFFCLVVVGVQFSAAASKEPTTWWPDPSTGLMWAGQTSAKMSWQESKDYCASLQLGGYSGWRLPTLDELEAIVYLKPIYTPVYTLGEGNTLYITEFKGGESFSSIGVWTSTLDGYKGAWTVGHHEQSEVAYGRVLLSGRVLGRLVTSALCTRPMEPDLWQLAKNAQVNVPVPDVLTLKAYIQLNKARKAYCAGQYQESIAQAKDAILIKPDLAPAYWAIGNSYIAMSEWDLAVANYEAALEIDMHFGDDKKELKWARKAQKTARSGKTPAGWIPRWE